MTDFKAVTIGILGGAGGFFINLWGGWDTALIALVIFMSIDYVTGLLVAGVFKVSPKSCGGGLESKAGYKGLVRKGVMLLIVMLACQLDLLLASDFIRSAVIIAFCANETISIIENAGLMGIPIPAVIKKAITMLQDSAEKEKNNV